MRNQVCGPVSFNTLRLGGSLLLASTVILAAACSGEHNPVSPSRLPDMSTGGEEVATSGESAPSALASPDGGGLSAPLGGPKTDLCHVTGTGDSVVISVAGGAVATHLAHGDMPFQEPSLAGASFSSSAGVAQLAFDGNPLTLWNAEDFPEQYIEIDFGLPQAILEIAGLVAQTPAGMTHHDVTLDGVPAFSWHGDTFDNQMLVHSFGTPRMARRIRITTTESRSWVAWRDIQFPAAACQPAA